MAVPSEVRRVQSAIENNNRKELEWSLWYAKMRQTVSSARPPDVKYWSAVERQVDELLNPREPEKSHPTRKKKKEGRGLGLTPLPGESDAAAGEELVLNDLSDPTFRPLSRAASSKLLTTHARTIKRVSKIGTQTGQGPAGKIPEETEKS